MEEQTHDPRPLPAVIVNGPRSAGTNALKAVLGELGLRERPGGLMDGRFYESREGRVAGRWRGLAEIDGALLPGELIGAHEPALVTRHVQIGILRQPRDLAVSLFRKQHREMPVTPADFRGWIETPDCVFFSRTAPFWRWWPSLDRAGIPDLIVWYDHLFDPDVVATIAAFCRVPAADVSAAKGRGKMWTGAPSDHREWFSPAALQRFDERWAAAVRGLAK